MANTLREVELALKVSTDNVEAIRKLRDDVSALAKEGGDAAPEFVKLTEELDKLAQQAAGLQKLEAAAQDVDKLAAAQAAAADRARELAASYGELRAKTDIAATSQAQALSNYNASKNEVQRLGDAIRQLKADYQGSARQSGEYTASLKDLTTQHLDARAKVRGLKTDLDESKAATAAARAEQNGLSNDTRNAATQSEALARKLGAQKTAMDELALATTGVVGAQADFAESGKRIAQELQAAASQAAALAAAQDKAALAAHELAQANEAAALRAKSDSASYANWWQEALAKQDAANQKVSASMRAQIAEAKASADAMRNAFGIVGAKSVEELESKIDATRSAMNLLKTSGALVGKELDVAFRQGDQAIASLERQIRAARGELTLMDRVTNTWNQSMGGMKVGTLLAAGAISALFQKVTEIGAAFVKAASENERLNQSLGNIYKSSTVATQQIGTLRKAANDAGISVDGIQQAFVKYSAAMAGANIPLQQSNELFGALTKAAGSLGLSSDEVNRALEALGQMASKGVVSMEELRQQLGDALPGALGIAARGLGMTEAEVIKLVSSGTMATKDFLPAFTTGLQTLGGQADTLSQNFNRLKNGVTAFFIAIGDSGALQVMKASMGAVATVGVGLALALAHLTEGFFNVGRMAGAAVAALAGGQGLSGAMDAMADVANASNARLEKLQHTLKGTGPAADAAAQGARVGSVALESMGAAAGRSGAALMRLDLAVGAQVESLTQAAAVSEINAKTAETLAGSVENVSKKITDQNIALGAEITAKQGVATATEKLLIAREQELALLQGHFEATALLLAQDGQLDAADIKRLQALAEQIEKQDALTGAVRAKLAATHESIGQSQIELETLRDNSERIDELRQAYDAAKTAVDNLRAAREQGIGTAEQEAAGLQHLSNVNKLLNDSYSDRIDKLQAKGIADQADIALQQASLKLQIANFDAMGALGKAIGDTNLVRQAEIGKIEVQIKMAEAHAKAMLAEAEGAIAVANATLAQMAATGQINPVQEAQLRASIKIAEAKKIEAEAILKGNEALSRQADALRNGTDGLDKHANASGRAGAGQSGFASATDGATSAIERQNAAIERQNAAIEKSIELENKRRNIDKEGFSLNTAGQKVVQQVDTRASVYQKAKSAGLDDAAALKIAEQFIGENGQILGQQNADTSVGENWYSVVQKAINDAVLGQAKAKTNGQQTTGKSYQVNVNLNGQATTINTSSDADAQALIALLERAKRAAGQ